MATNTSTFPVCALHCYVNSIVLANQSGPLFTDRFTPSKVQVTSAIYVNYVLQGNVVIQSHYSGHSFSICAATWIKDIGHWKSNAYESYAHFPPSLFNAVPSILACTDTITQSAWNSDDQIPISNQSSVMIFRQK